MMAFEAVVVAMFLFLAVAMFSAMQPPRNSIPNQGAHDQVRDYLRDLLTVMDMMGDPEYGTKLKRFVVECSNGDDSNFTAFMRSALPVGLEYRLAVNQNSKMLHLCKSSWVVPREMVSESLLMWGWAQDAAFVVPEYRNYDGDEMAMGVTVIPVRNGYVEEVFRDMELEVEMELEGQVYTQIHRLALRPGPHVTVGVVKGADVVGYDDRDQIIRHTIRVTESGGAGLPAGSELRLLVPTSWTDIAHTDHGPGWNSAGLMSDGDWHLITAKLNDTLVNGSIDFSFNGTRPVEGSEGAAPFHRVLVEVRGTYNTRSEVLFEGKEDTASLAGELTRSVVLNLPERATPASTATWRLVVMNPDPEESQQDQFTGACLTNCRTLSRVTIRQPDGLPLFTSVVGSGWALDGGGPSNSTTWTGSVEMASDAALELPLTVSLADEEAGTAYNATRRVQFPAVSASMDLTSTTGMGMHEGRFGVQGASLPGYPSVVGPGANLEVCSDVHLDSRMHAGCAGYTIRRTPAFLSAREAVALGAEGSSVAVLNATNYAPGDWITVHANFSALDAAMSAWPPYLATAETEITLYHPWTAQNGTFAGATPWWQQTRDDGDVMGAVQVEEPVVWGTYVVVAERRFNLTANVGLGQPFELTDENTDQVVRKVTWVTIGKRPLLERTHFHTIALQGWMRDWQ